MVAVPKRPKGASRRGWHYYGPYLNCPRLGFFRHTHKLVPIVTPKALRIGLLAHAGLEAADRGKDIGEAVHGTGRWIDSDGKATLYAHDEQEAIKLVADYRAYWSKTKDRLEFIAIEKEARVMFETDEGGMPFTVRYDGIARWFSDGHDAGLWLVERKTQGFIRGDPGKAWIGHGQTTGQWVTWQQWRETARRRGKKVPRQVKGVLMDIIGKSVGAKNRFQRRPLPRPTEIQSKSFVASIAYAAELADRVKSIPLEGYEAVPCNFEACQGKYRKCDYWDVCMRGPQFLSDFKKHEWRK